MKYLKSIWSERTPNYNEDFQTIFNKLANKSNEGGDNDDRATETGKIFATQYELYIYAYFIGLYANQQQECNKKSTFGHKISEWGKKTRKTGRESFLEIQDFIFISLITKTGLNFIELEQTHDEDEIKKAVTLLIELMESYANGGLQLIKDKLDSNENCFISSMEAPLNFLLSIVLCLYLYQAVLCILASSKIFVVDKYLSLISLSQHFNLLAKSGKFFLTGFLKYCSPIRGGLLLFCSDRKEFYNQA